MRISLPIYVEKQVLSDRYHFILRPLFHQEPRTGNATLERGEIKLKSKLRKHLVELAREPLHEGLADFSFNPDLRTRLLDLRLFFKKRTFELRLLFCDFQGLGTRLGFSPTYPDLWFTLPRGSDLRTRAEEVMTLFLQKKLRENSDYEPETLENGKAWITTFELNISIPFKRKKKEPIQFLMLGGSEEMDGQDELQKVGNCLEWDFPGGLARALCRERELAELERLFSDSRLRPVLLVGPRGVGKTALLVELIYRKVEKAKEGGRQDPSATWLLAPQILISGMSYVGQWESRVQAILKEAGKRKHLLYFDDFLGLFRAGISAGSDLNVAQVLKPYAKRGDVRILAEMTGEELNRLRELDRGFADLFYIVRLAPLPEIDVLRVLLSVRRRLEASYNCRFDPDVLPEVLDLMRRFGDEAVLPGKAVSFLERLAHKNRDRDLDRHRVLEELASFSGLSLGFLDANANMERRLVTQTLSRQVIGQEPAINAVTDHILMARARLDDPTRPFGSFLFLGPTGVGKTETAKTLASYLYGSETRLLRFDMNEYVDAGAAGRLVGTYHNPQGLLTQAVRRYPFSVILFDEIEKADPTVYDLLLQVLGEGRLTDSFGKTADFTRTMIVLTSNLGVSEAGASLGLTARDQRSVDTVYRKAAESFFRPEFFNRIDRIVPFHALEKSEVKRIARLLIDKIFDREGLLRRKCILQVRPEVLDRVSDLGYQPELGARALKRAIEREITVPLARRLSLTAPDLPVMIELKLVQDQIHSLIWPLRLVRPIAYKALTHARVADLLANFDLDPLEREIDKLGPDGEISLDYLPERHLPYFTLRKHLRHLKESLDAINDRLDWLALPTSMRHKKVPPPRPDSVVRLREPWPETGILEAENLATFLEPVSSLKPGPDEADPIVRARVIRLQQDLALFRLNMAPPKIQNMLVCLHGFRETSYQPLWWLRDSYRQLGFDLNTQWLTPEMENAGEAEMLLVSGAGAQPLLEMEAGYHLFLPGWPLSFQQDWPQAMRSGRRALDAMALVRVTVHPLNDDKNDRSYADWVRFAQERESVDELPVIRLYGAKGASLDLHTGTLTFAEPKPRDLVTMLLTRLVAKEEMP